MHRTKIVATIGPDTRTPVSLLALKDAGMSMVRLNGSHNSLDWHDATIAMVREVLPGVPVLLDIPGRKIRTTDLAVEPSFEAGDTVVLTTEPDHDGAHKVPVNKPDLHKHLKAGNRILADDGTLSFTVHEVDGRDIVCRAETGGTLRSRKGINVPFVKLESELVTQRDRDMVAFAVDNGVDFIGISFVESADHVAAIRELIDGSFPRIISKIENQGGLDHMDEIMETTDGAMIDRGDLSVETNFEELALFQKRILQSAERHSKPVIVATEMLHSMITNANPTKAELCDISNAVLDGCSATMLSGETAVGAYPREAVATMRKVADSAEAHRQSDLEREASANHTASPEVMSQAIAMICRSLPITKIVAVTRSGYAARMIAARHPKQPIIAVSDDAAAARSFNLYRGTEGVHVDVPFERKSTDHIVQCLKELWRQDYLEDEDLILVTAVGYPHAGNRMNHIQTHIVADLKDTLDWQR